VDLKVGEMLGEWKNLQYQVVYEYRTD
jgi:hypothetical protein